MEKLTPKQSESVLTHFITRIIKEASQPPDQSPLDWPILIMLLKEILTLNQPQRRSIQSYTHWLESFILNQNPMFKASLSLSQMLKDGFNIKYAHIKIFNCQIISEQSTITQLDSLQSLLLTKRNTIIS